MVEELNLLLLKLKEVKGEKKAYITKDIAKIYTITDPEKGREFSIKTVELADQYNNLEIKLKGLRYLAKNCVLLNLKTDSYLFFKDAIKLAKDVENIKILKLLYKEFSDYSKTVGDYKTSYEMLYEVYKIEKDQFAEQFSKEIAKKEVEIFQLKKNCGDEVLQEKLNQKNEEITKLYQKIEILERVDNLTQLWNRRYFREKLEEEKLRFDRNGKKFTILIAEVDNYNYLFSRYGFNCGEYLIVVIANQLRTLLRQQDIIARWGEHRFIVLLPETNLKGGKDASEKVRTHIKEQTFWYQQLEISLTLSFGIASLNRSLTLDQTINLAENSLLKSIENGGDVVSFEQDIDEEILPEE